MTTNGKQYSTKHPNPLDKEIGARIRTQRLVQGMSQEQLADAIGLTFQQVQKYEKGSNRCSGSRLHQIATALDTTAAFLVSGQKTYVAGGLSSDVFALLDRADALRLLRAFDRLVGKVRSSIVELVENVANATQPPSDRTRDERNPRGNRRPAKGQGSGIQLRNRPLG